MSMVSKLAKSRSSTSWPLEAVKEPGAETWIQWSWRTSVTVCVPGPTSLMLQLPSSSVTADFSPLLTMPSPSSSRMIVQPPRPVRSSVVEAQKTASSYLCQLIMSYADFAKYRTSTSWPQQVVKEPGAET